MSRIDLQPSLLDRVLGHSAPGRGDQAASDRLERLLHDVAPDPLFKRRLRGSIVNYHVAGREGHLARRGRTRTRGQMGTIGRSVLYASVLLALGVSAVGAAAQDTVPGDALYSVKLRLEEVRMQIAPPSVRGQLAAIALAERIDELEQLADRGEWDRVATAAGRVVAAESQAAQDPVAVVSPMGASAAHAVEVLQAVLDKAPAVARPKLEAALRASSHGTAGNQGQGQEQGKHRGQDQGKENGPKASPQTGQPSSPPQAQGGSNNDGNGPAGDGQQGSDTSN